MAVNQASSSRYPSLTNRSSSFSNLPPCSSADHKASRKNLYHLNRLTGNSIESSNSQDQRSNSSRFTQILAKTKSISPSPKTKNEQNFGIMVKKFMEKRVKPKPELFTNSVDLKKTGPKVLNITAFNRKLFPNGKTDGKALTNVNSNARTLSLVLKSERDLLNQNKEYEAETAELRWLLEEKSKEVEKLKSTCLKQMEQIQALKGAILFLDETNSKLKELSDDQGSDLLQDKQANPITSLRGQLRCLAVDPAEVPFPDFALYYVKNILNTSMENEKVGSNPI